MNEKERLKLEGKIHCGSNELLELRIRKKQEEKLVEGEEEEGEEKKDAGEKEQDRLWAQAAEAAKLPNYEVKGETE